MLKDYFLIYSSDIVVVKGTSVESLFLTFYPLMFLAQLINSQSVSML